MTLTLRPASKRYPSDAFVDFPRTKQTVIRTAGCNCLSVEGTIWGEDGSLEYPPNGPKRTLSLAKSLADHISLQRFAAGHGQLWARMRLWRGIARDNNVLDVVRKGEGLSLNQWADCFVENCSKPPLRAEKTHQINLRAARHPKSAFGSSKLVDITADHMSYIFVIVFNSGSEPRRLSVSKKEES